MDIQFALLSLLSCRPMTGYDLKRAIQESAYMHWSGNNNQIYKALLSLLGEGLVTCEVQHQQSAPSRKVYTVTREGAETIKKWLMSVPEPPEYRKEFLIRLICADVLESEELAQLIGAYENEVRIQAAMQQEKMRRETGAGARTPREALLWRLADESVLVSLKAELEWIKAARVQIAEKVGEEGGKGMKFQVIETQQGQYVEVISSAEPVRTEQDALELVALCGTNDTTRLMVHSEVLSEEFFRLRTGVAGAVLQKLINYHIRTVVLLTDAASMRGKFRDMAAEARRGNQFRVFENAQDAEHWLMI